MFENHGHISMPKYSDYVGQPMISFVYDDGATIDLNVSVALHLYYNLPMCSAQIGNEMKYADGSTKVQVPGFLDAQKHGVAFASHSYTHPSLTSLNELARWNEMKNSKDLFESMGFRNVDTFVCPHNDWSVDYIPEAKAAGYQCVMALWGGGSYNNVPLASENVQSGRYFLNRIAANNPKTGEQVIAEIQAGIDAKAWIIVMLHQLKDADDGTTYNWIKNEALKMLDFVAAKPKSQLLPINPGLAVRFLTGKKDYVPRPRTYRRKFN